VNWFQRYGIPGAVFWGLLILWIIAFYKDESVIDNINGDSAKLIAAIVAGSFLPIGFLVSVIGQLAYLVIPCIGVDTRARKRAGLSIEPRSNLEYKHEVESVLLIMKEASSNLGKHKFVQEWMRKRMDVAAIAGSLFWGIFLAPMVALLPAFFDCKIQIHYHPRWLSLAGIVSVIIFFISLVAWLLLTSQLVRLESAMFENSQKRHS